MGCGASSDSERYTRDTSLPNPTPAASASPDPFFRNQSTAIHTRSSFSQAAPNAAPNSHCIASGAPPGCSTHSPSSCNTSSPTASDRPVVATRANILANGAAGVGKKVARVEIQMVFMPEAEEPPVDSAPFCAVRSAWGMVDEVAPKFPAAPDSEFPLIEGDRELGRPVALDLRGGEPAMVTLLRVRRALARRHGNEEWVKKYCDQRFLFGVLRMGERSGERRLDRVLGINESLWEDGARQVPSRERRTCIALLHSKRPEECRPSIDPPPGSGPDQGGRTEAPLLPPPSEAEVKVLTQAWPTIPTEAKLGALGGFVDSLLGEARVNKLFNRAVRDVHMNVLLTFLDTAMEALPTPDALSEVLKKLGKRHALYDVQEEQFIVAGGNLRDCMHDALGGEFISAWHSFCDWSIQELRIGADTMDEEEWLYAFS